MGTPAQPPKPPMRAKERSEAEALSVGPDLGLRSTSFAPQERIPSRYTADGDNRPPALTWNTPPKKTQALALLCEDPDAPTPSPFVHWLVSDIDPARVDRMLWEGASSIPGAVQGKTSFGRVGYGGPEPPRGHGTHHYHFHLYALDARLRLEEGFSKKDLLQKMKDHVLASGELIGTYSR
ncbi:MAG TPA: YbhB/YbcL family Raf kinase inhibitor-like protein [Planctomycetota bacterium]|nr:YbhB/YbcL family Raf kinase inhibitor-like protein [Planctomycetota bacterium]